jgi:hypothetical protein
MGLIGFSGTNLERDVIRRYLSDNHVRAAAMEDKAETPMTSGEARPVPARA